MTTYVGREYWARMHRQNRGLLSAVGYAAFGEGFNRAAYMLRRRALRRLLRRNIQLAAPSILEAAPGVGAYAEEWRRLSASAWVGLDISAEAVAHCRRRYPEGLFLEQDLAAAEWPDEALQGARFDLVTAVDVLYHLVEEKAFETALANLAARVACGGWLLVSDVFVPRDKQIAAHVKRRSLETYQAVLGPEMVLVDREPVFAILGDPVPRSRRRIDDQALLAAWRLIARCLLGAPSRLRGALGAAAVMLAWPVDGLLRRLGAARGVNLELALFRRLPGGEQEKPIPTCAA